MNNAKTGLGHVCIQHGRHLDGIVFKSYLQRLRDAGSDADLRADPLFSSSAAAVRYALTMLPGTLASVLDRELIPVIEQVFGQRALRNRH